jgi:hypothetical protein
MPPKGSAGGVHDPHAAYRQKIDADIDRHDHAIDRFKAFVNGVLDNAPTMRTKTIAEQDAAIADLRAHLEDAWNKITGGRAK